jgi:superfamily II DNA or RNA helicase
VCHDYPIILDQAVGKSLLGAKGGLDLQMTQGIGARGALFRRIDAIETNTIFQDSVAYTTHSYVQCIPVEHAENLINLDQQNLADALVHGKTPLKQRKEKLKQFTTGDRKILLGTASLFGEGFDAPMLSHLINAAGGKSPIQIVQRAGRSSRVSDGKSMGYVVDFVDSHLRTLSNHRILRTEIYQSLGYTQTRIS